MLLAEQFALASREVQLVDPTPDPEPAVPDELQNDLNRPFVLSELNKVITKMKNTAPGDDGILPAFIKNLTTTHRRALLKIYNVLYLRDQLPQQWREAKIIPILKPAADPSRVTNYRPIALTSHLGKILEKLVTARLNYTIEKQDLLTDSQYGFRKYRSTEIPMAVLQTVILEGMANGYTTGAVFFDITKAYDMASRPHIIQQLEDWGFLGHILEYVKNFLGFRPFRTSVEGVLSDYYIQERGVPQGSAISPLLFLILINSIVKVLPPGVSILLFADDIVIYTTQTALQTVEERLQAAINAMVDWANSRGLSFSAAKTKSLVFYKYTTNPGHLHLTLQQDQLQQVEQHRFLGLIFDRMLSWAPHLGHLKAECRKRLDLLRTVASTRWGSDKHTLLKFHTAFVVPKLLYGSAIFATANRQRLQTLCAVHHEGVRIGVGAFKSSPIKSLLVEAEMLPLQMLWDQAVMILYYRLRCTPSGNQARSLTMIHDRENYYRYYGGKRYGSPLAVRLSIVMDQYDLHRVCPRNYQWPQYPQWTSKVKTNLTLAVVKKREAISGEYQTRFREVQHSHPQAREIYTDGSKIETGVGASVVFEEEVCKIGLNPLASVFTAELLGIQLALDLAEDRNEEQPRHTLICTDSQAAIKIISNAYTDHPIASAIRTRLVAATKAGLPPTILVWTPGHAGIPGNEKADQAAREAARAVPQMDLICKDDLQAAVKSKTREKWEQQWQEIPPGTVKLRDIRQTTKRWSTSSHPHRRREVVMARLRIGHTRLTHGYLMDRSPPPECADCGTSLTVAHILTICNRYARLRQQHDLQGNLQDILQDSTQCQDNLWNFLISSGLDKVL